MDPTSWTSKLDGAVKALLILMAGATVCVGFLFFKLITQDQFMPFAYMVMGAAFGRGMQMMSGFTKTTETGPDGVKKETTQSTPAAVVMPTAVVVPTSPVAPIPSPTPTPVTIVNPDPVPVDVVPQPPKGPTP